MNERAITVAEIYDDRIEIVNLASCQKAQAYWALGPRASAWARKEACGRALGRAACIRRQRTRMRREPEVTSQS